MSEKESVNEVTESKEEGTVRAIRMDGATYAGLKELAQATGLKMGDLHRMALRNLLESVAETGRLPIPDINLSVDMDGKEGVA